MQNNSENKSIEEIYDIIKNSQGKTPEFIRENFIEEIVEFLRLFVESKIIGKKEDNKISIKNTNIFQINTNNRKIFEDIALSIKSKEIPWNEVVFSKDEPITGIYILVDGKIGLWNEGNYYIHTNYDKK